MNVLFVNHTFPPESYAGSELCVLNLARAMQSRGHEVAVVYRYGNPAHDEYALVEDQFEGIPVYKINNTFRFAQNFQRIYENPYITFRFGEVLGRFQPDVVHFHHITNLSLSMVQEAKSRGCVVVFTLHDYWLLCQRGQLLKRDLTLCHGPSPSACRACLSVQLLRGKRQQLNARLLSVKNRFVKRHEIKLLDSLNKAEINTPSRDFVGQSRFGLGEEVNPGKTVPVLLAHPPAEIRYLIPLESSAVFKTAIAMHPSTYNQSGAGVCFDALWNGESIFSKTLNPKVNPEDRGWHDVRVELPVQEGNNTLVLKTSAQAGDDNAFCTAGWLDPVILPQKQPPADASPTMPKRGWSYRIAETIADAVVHLTPDAWYGIEHRRRWVQQVFDEVDLFISPSEFLRDFFIRHGLPQDKIVFSDNGFPPPPSSGDKKDVKQPIRFGYIGTWIPSKGVDLAVRAFQQIDPKQARLIVHGFFPGFDGYENYEQDLKAMAGGAVEFRGKYNPADVYRLLEEIDCLVMPSIWWENSPMTIHEAFQAGVPVITADVGGMAEQVKPGGGLTFKHRDADDLQRVLLRVINDPNLLNDLRQSIPNVKSVKAHADEIENYYARTLNKKQNSTL